MLIIIHAALSMTVTAKSKMTIVCACNNSQGDYKRISRIKHCIRLEWYYKGIYVFITIVYVITKLQASEVYK